MKFSLFAVAAVIATLSSSIASAQGSMPGSIKGVWANPSGHVHVRIAECGTQLCGTVVYATDQAKADAAKAGTPNLIGVNLFREFGQKSEGIWEGKVLVPDLKKTVSGQISVIDANRLDVKGCLFGHVACKDQQWTRMPS